MADYQATTTTSPSAAPLPADYPGKTLGIVGLVLAIVAAPVGLILSAVALNQSKKAGFPNKLAKIGVILGIILTIVNVVVLIAYIAFVASVMQNGMYTG